jgi:acyl carrier protein
MNRTVDAATIDILRASHAFQEAQAARLDDVALLAASIDELNFDSLEKLEFVMKLEDAFAIMLDETAIEMCGTVLDLTLLIGKALDGAKAC